MSIGEIRRIVEAGWQGCRTEDLPQVHPGVPLKNQQKTRTETKRERNETDARIWGHPNFAEGHKDPATEVAGSAGGNGGFLNCHSVAIKERPKRRRGRKDQEQSDQLKMVHELEYK